MVPVATRAKHYEYFMLENCTQTSRAYWSKNPIELLCIYIWWIYLRLNSQILLILVYFHNFEVYFINRYLTVWGITIVFPQIPLFSLKNVRYFHSFVESCIGTICHNKDFTGRVLLWENFISPRNNLCHTKMIFLATYRSPNGPHLLRENQPIRSPENPGTTVFSFGHHGPKSPEYRTQLWDNPSNVLMQPKIFAHVWCYLVYCHGVFIDFPPTNQR